MYNFYKKNVESFINIKKSKSVNQTNPNSNIIYNDINGTVPIISGKTSSWSNGPVVNTPPEIIGLNTNCSPGTTCNDKNLQFGIYNSNCDCISPANSEKKINIPNTNNIEVKSIYPSPTPVSPTPELPPPLDKDCYINNTNFDKICKMQNNNYGIKKLIPCNTNYSKVECGLNYINGVDYGDDVTITPCLNKSDDFDTWCRFYNDKSKIPKGYNINSIGSKKVLVGSEGGCYTINGKSDNNSARAVCDYKHMEQITRLDPANNKINYNIYTDCLPLNSNNFIPSCINLMNNDSALVTQVMGYDCNPGYGRAKCLNKNDKRDFDSNFFNKSYGKDYNSKHIDLNISCSEKCKKV